MNSFVLIPLSPCPEDVNQDGTVDRLDLDIVLNYSQTDQCPTGEICWADVNGDYRVDQQDVTQVIEAFGTCGQGRWAEGYEPPFGLVLASRSHRAILETVSPSWSELCPDS